MGKLATPGLGVTAPTMAVLIAGALVPNTAAASQAEPSVQPTAPQITTVSLQTDRSDEVWTSENIRKALSNRVDLPKKALDNASTEAKQEDLLKSRSTTPVVTSRPERAPDPGAAMSATQGMVPGVGTLADRPVAYEMSRDVKIGFLAYGDQETDEFGSCTASVISTDTNDTIWTAAHCVHEGDGSGDAGFYPYLSFFPGVDEEVSGLGYWWGVEVRASRDYTEETDLAAQQHVDIAAVELTKTDINEDHGQIADTVGAFGYTFGSADHPEATLAGYPMEDPSWGSQNLWACSGNTEDAGNLNPLDDRLMMDCSMAVGGGGSSGGPWWIESAENGQQLIGTTSHASTLDPIMYSSEHGQIATAILDSINASA